MPVFPFSANIEAPPTREYESALYARERENFIRLLYLAQFPELAAALVYVATMAGLIGWQMPLIWLFVMFLAMTFRFVAVNHTLSDIAKIPERFTNILSTNFFCGFCWGISAFYFTQSGNEVALFVVMIWLVGMMVSAMGLVTVSSMHPILWASPVVLMLLLRMLIEGNLTFTLLAVGLVLLILLFSAIVYFARSIIRRDFYSERQNASLVEQLSLANDNARRLNDELHAEISRREKLENVLRLARDLAERRSTTDSLTGINNRRAFDCAISEEVPRARRNQHVLSLILIDVDRFKNYNDARGHQAGDEVLRHVASVIEKSTRRGTDKSYRYGGEEFAVLLPNTDLTHALRIGESIRRELEQTQLEHPDSEVSPYVTISLGVAAITPTEHGTGKVLLETADQALYQAKSAGRNQTKKIH